MFTQHFERSDGYRHRQPADRMDQILVVPGAAEHAEKVAMLDLAAYEYGEAALDDPYGPEETVEMFLQSLNHFPEGQFVAIDRTTGDIVGRTASMRYHYDPTRTLLESWAASTGDG